jgi:microcompartment protein CcmK/EutM
MILARVRGTVVSATRTDRIEGGRYLIVSPEGSGESLVALDLVQADREQLVLVSQGSSARQSTDTINTAVDAVIVGIVASVNREVNLDG